jgi:mono/diheme cytochrome c family protein
MQDQPRYEEFEAGDRKFFRDEKVSREPIEGTVPRVPRGQSYVDRQTEYLYTGRVEGSIQGAAAAGAAQQTGTVPVRANVPTGGAEGALQSAAQGGPDVFPFPVTEEFVKRGQERFNVFCAMCHGMTGNGDGMIVRRGFRKPPSFHEDRLQEPVSSASHFFDVVTNGWGAMPSYASTIPAEDRWKIIAYVRALQFSRKARLEELPPEMRAKVESPGQAPHTPSH